MATISERIGTNARKLRKGKKLSQDTVGEGLGLHQAGVCRVELGEQNLIPEQLLNLAQLLSGEVLMKRHLFAGMALQGILANPKSYSETGEEIASMAVIYADALLLELARTEKKSKEART